ncbi:MAG: hypothetical protein E7413_02065 [Ruminococcaceae bacterium]|nr:hypothetical protein [Oscillospiraceae bacterium]
MKKLLILLLISTMTLSLCACSNQNAANSTTVSYDDAPEADFKKIYEECSENIVAAENQYIGKPYQFSGWVYAVNKEFLAVVPLQFPKYASYGSWYLVRISMPEDEMLKVKAGEFITVGGTFSELDTTSSKMNNGVYLDNVVPFEGKVSFVLDSETFMHIMEIKQPDSDITYRYVVKKADTIENIEEATINGVTFKKDDFVQGTAMMTRKDSYVNTYDITEIVSIEK